MQLLLQSKELYHFLNDSSLLAKRRRGGQAIIRTGMMPTSIEPSNWYIETSCTLQSSYGALENEAFYGRNHTAMAEWIKSYDPTRLIHYEPDIEAEHVDMYSRMYPRLEDIIDFAKDKTKTKPLVLCEFIHAMGTGPGNIKEYVDAFYDYPRLQGGWVWEWANHGLLKHNENGQPYYGYGGDFGDVPNDYNFVMDGVLDSNHDPNSGLVEYKKSLEPIQVVASTPEKIIIINRLDFANLDHLTCGWSIVHEGGTGRSSGTVGIPRGVQPGATAELPMPKFDITSDKERLLELSFRLKERSSWADASYELAFAQVPLSTVDQVHYPEPGLESVLKLDRNASSLNVSGPQVQWTVDLVNGRLASWQKNGKRVIAAPLELSFYRAPTDNDAPNDGKDWKDRMMHLASVHTVTSEWFETNDQVIVVMQQQFAPPVLSWSIDLETRYTFNATGFVTLSVRGSPKGSNLPRTLPRIGVTLGLLEDYKGVDWFGRGIGESYRDMKLSQRVGHYSVSDVDELWTGPEFPQECSNRTDTRWLRLSSEETTVTAQFFEPKDTKKRCLFDFMACHFDVKDIDDAQHPFELEKKRKDHVVLRLDADHHGLGSGSCGPKTRPEYELRTEDFEFGLLLY